MTPGNDLIYQATRSMRVCELAQAYGLSHVASWDADMWKYHGVPTEKAKITAAVFSLARRLKEPEKKIAITCPADIAANMSWLAEEQREQLWAVHLDNAGNIIIADQVTAGLTDRSAVDIPMILRRAIVVNATAVVLVHNHPSGQSTPSRDDIDITKQIRDAAKLMNILIHDHIIICKHTYVSMVESGLI